MMCSIDPSSAVSSNMILCSFDICKTQGSAAGRGELRTICSWSGVDVRAKSIMLRKICSSQSLSQNDRCHEMIDFEGASSKAVLKFDRSENRRKTRRSKRFTSATGSTGVKETIRSVTSSGESSANSNRNDGQSNVSVGSFWIWSWACMILLWGWQCYSK